MFSWAYEVAAPEVCIRLLMQFYKLSQEQVSSHACVVTYEASFEYMTLCITTILRLTKYCNMGKKVSVIVMTELRYNVNVVA